MAVGLALARCRFSLPYMSCSTEDFDSVTRWGGKFRKVHCFSQALLLPVNISALHAYLESLLLCFLSSVTNAVAPAATPASYRITAFQK